VVNAVPAAATRWFAALAPSPALLPRLLALREQLIPNGATGWRRLDHRDLHLTLRYFGAVKEAALLVALSEALARAAAARPPFPLVADDVQLWPARGQRPLVLTFAPSAPLDALVDAIASETLPLGFAPERRPFRAHLTLARARAGCAAAALPQSGIAALPPWDADALLLYRSERHAAGRRYLPEQRWPLPPG
jgi:RNA 2',3'-cyclic 3'-phosphodiesterase